MGELTPEQKRDSEVTSAIVDVISTIKLSILSFSHLCEAGADYLEARTRERFFEGSHPAKMMPKIGRRPLPHEGEERSAKLKKKG